MKVGRVPTDAMASGVEALCSAYTVVRPTEGGSDPLGGSSSGEPTQHSIQAYMETPSPELSQTDTGEEVVDMVNFRAPMGTNIQKDDRIQTSDDSDGDDVEYEVNTVTEMPTNQPSELKITTIKRS